MVGRTGALALLVTLAFWSTGCSRDPERETNAPASANAQQITLRVPGMIDRQGIT